MALSLEELDKQIVETQRKLSELEAFRSLYIKYGGITPTKNGDSRRVPTKKPSPPRASVAGPPNSNGLKAAILGLGLPGQFTVDDLVAALRAKGLSFGRRQVRDSVHILAKKHQGLRRVEQGLGGSPSKYERVSI